MTQFQFDVICKLIDNGAPALAVELKKALVGLAQSLEEAVTENEQLKAMLKTSTENQSEPDVTEK